MHFEWVPDLVEVAWVVDLALLVLLLEVVRLVLLVGNHSPPVRSIVLVASLEKRRTVAIIASE